MPEESAPASALITEILRTAAAMGTGRPWKELDGSESFAVTIPGSDRIWAVTVLGAARQQYAVCFYEGVEGVAFVSDAAEGSLDASETMSRFQELNGYTVDFFTLSELEDADCDLLARAGVLPRSGPEQRKGRWPVLRRIEAGLVPAPLSNEEEVKELAALLESFAQAFALLREDRSLIAWDPMDGWDDESFDEDDEEEDEDLWDFHNFPLWRSASDGAGGSFVRIDLAEPDDPFPPIELSPDAHRSLFRLRAEDAQGRDEVVWEIGRTGIGKFPSERAPGKDEFAEACLVVDAESGIVIAVQPGAVRDRVKVLGELLSTALLNAKQLPAVLVTNDGPLFDLLYLFGEAEDFQIETDSTPACDEACASIRKHLGR